MLRQWHAGQLVFQLARAIPYLHFTGEFALRKDERVRPMNPAYQNMLAVRRGPDLGEYRWFANVPGRHGRGMQSARLTALGIDELQLRRGVIIEQVLVVRIL